MSLLLTPCDTGIFLKPCDSGIFLKPCPIACWVAAIVIIGTEPTCDSPTDPDNDSDDDSVIGGPGDFDFDAGTLAQLPGGGRGSNALANSVAGGFVTIRSNSPPGTVLALPITIPYYYGTCVDPTANSATLSKTLNVTVGASAGWSNITTYTENGWTFRVWMSSAALPAGVISPMPAPPVITTPPWCEWSDEWGIYLGDTTCGSSGASPIHLFDTSFMTALVAQLNSDAGTNGNGAGILPFFSLSGNAAISTTMAQFIQSVGGANFMKVTDAPLVLQGMGQTGFNVLNVDSIGAGFPDVPSGPNVFKLPSFNRCAYTPPSSHTTDDIFDLTVTNYNPYTGNAVDGTHTNCDGQVEGDTAPAIDLVGGDPSGCGEQLFYSSLSRLSFGVYKFTGCQFQCQAGSRQIEVGPAHQQPFSFPLGGQYVTTVMVPSGPITVTAGAPNCTDMPQSGSPTYPVFYFRVNEPLLIAGQPIMGRILDYMGNSCLFNVCLTATNNLTLYWLDNGGNAVSTPAFTGTTTQPAVAGVASFPGVSLYALGGLGADQFTWTKGYKLSVQDPLGFLGLSGNHNSWYLAAGFTCGLAFETLPTITHGVAATIKVDLVDYSGSPINPDVTQDDVTLSGSFTGSPMTVTPSGGVASFTVTFPSAGTSTLTAATSGVTYYGPGSPAPGQSDPAITTSVTVT